MKLAKKEPYQPQYKQQEQVYKKPPVVDWKTHEIAWNQEIPYGKWKGHTLEELEYEDDWYFSWMFREHIIESWGLYRPKTQVKKKVTRFVSSTGAVWIDLVEVEVTDGEISPYL